MNTLDRKARGDLTRHRTRTLLAVGTLAIAIASLGFLAVPGLLNAAMNRQVQQGRLNEVAISTRVTGLTPAQLGALGRRPGVAAVSADLGYVTTTASVGGAQNIVIDGGGLASAPVNTVLLMSGRLPGPGEALADVADGKAAGYTVPVGGTLGVRAASGATAALRISGTGLNLAYTPGANSTGTPVFYTSAATAQALSGTRGYNHLGFRLTDDSPAAQDRVIAEVRAYLTAQTGSDPVTSLPYTRAPGYWPGQTGFNDITAVLYIITALALSSALFLIAATMNTLIAEQAREIAILKALGGRRRQIGGITARTAAMLGLAGAIVGTAAGLAVAYLLARYFAGRIADVSFGFGVSVPVIAASLVAGPVLAVAASLPALRRALRRPAAETLTGAGTDGGYGVGWLDRAAARGRTAGRLPDSLRQGFRDVLRQRRRSTAVIIQIAVAAGLAMSFLALGQSITSDIAQAVGKLHFSVSVGEAGSGTAHPFGPQALVTATATPGVTAAQPVETSAVQYNGQAYTAWGLGPRPLYSYRLSAGRWLTTADAAAGTPPVVLGPVVADASGARVGQDLTLDMAAGPVRVRVIGIDTGRNNSGNIVYFPLPVLERLDGTPGAANSLWVSTASTAHPTIDQAATAVASRLAAAGYPVTTTKIYALEAQYTASENSVLAIVEILGLVVVAIMLMGLAGALTMGIIERTREIGILRCLGARSRHIRRIFSTEAVVLTLAGWALGILLGWLIYQGLLILVRHDADLTLPQDFPPAIPLITLAGVLVLTLIVIRGPLHRATRIQPGTALRYQ
ncbi:MAG TPA: FtsX-like permease family protein [Trebonia sp.]